VATIISNHLNPKPMKKLKDSVLIEFELTPSQKQDAIDKKIKELIKLYEQKHIDLDKELVKEKERITNLINKLTRIDKNLDLKEIPKSRTWTTEQLDDLKLLYGTLSDKELANQLHKPLQTFLNKVIELNLKPSGPYQWKTKEENELIEYYSKSMKEDEISEKMNIPSHIIKTKIAELKAQKSKLLKKIAPEEYEKLFNPDKANETNNF
jgi:hypothetical protein